MIDRPEIMEFAREFGLAPNVVEKDYVLGWLLAEISNHAELAATWVFKGGTCLKKCYFETYRFSEDLDFTLPDAEMFDEARLIQIFSDIAEWVVCFREEDGVRFAPRAIRENLVPNMNGMNARDAVYILEQLGMTTNLEGRGKVSSQSLSPGSRCQEGTEITLKLSERR